MKEVGVLALQGDFAEHVAILSRIDASPFEVRTREDLERAHFLVIPGGESTTILKLIDRYELREPLVKRISEGMPVFGTCAGAIVMASDVSDGESPLGVLDMTITRNAYGRQVDSFEASFDVEGLKEPVTGVFIRAPVIERVGPDAQILATWGTRPVLVLDGTMLVSTFHPELAGETRIHEMFLKGA